MFMAGAWRKAPCPYGPDCGSHQYRAQACAKPAAESIPFSTFVYVNNKQDRVALVYDSIFMICLGYFGHYDAML
jgi:hypothetical protein